MMAKVTPLRSRKKMLTPNDIVEYTDGVIGYCTARMLCDKYGVTPNPGAKRPRRYISASKLDEVLDGTVKREEPKWAAPKPPEPPKPKRGRPGKSWL